MRTYKEIVATLEHRNDINSVAISPDGSDLAVGVTDNEVRFWNLKGTISSTLFDLKNTPTRFDAPPVPSFQVSTHPYVHQENKDLKPLSYPPIRVREAQDPQSIKHIDNGKNPIERDHPEGANTTLQTRPNVSELAQKEVTSSAELHWSEPEPPPVPPKTINGNGKGSDRRLSISITDNSGVSADSGAVENSSAPEQRTQDTAWNLEDIRSRFPTDLTGHVERGGEDPIASGSYGDIYKGTLRVSAKSIEVAVKAIRTYSADDDDHAHKKKKLRREIRVWLNLDHINVLPLFGTTTGFGRFPAMVCPWLEDGTLLSYLERWDDSLTTGQRLVLLGDVAAGLQYLHSKSVVHGDLSGSNVLIHGNGRACIADFGLSTLLTALGGSTFATSFQARGTLRWAAPELLALEVPESDDNPPRVVPTPESDMYSFGGIMLLALTGKVPYHYYPRDERVLLALSRRETPKRPSGKLVTDTQWTFIQTCWASPNWRPSDEEIVKFIRHELAEIVETAGDLQDIRSLPSDLTNYVLRGGEDPIAYSSYDTYKCTVCVGGANNVTVAVKAIRTYPGDGSDHALKQERFRQEIEVWLSLEHSNVLPLFGTTMGFGRFPAMICMWLEDGSLTSYLARSDTLTMEERLSLAHDVAMGLQYLHSKSVVHGDLSGSNVLIRADGRACVADAGLSALLTALGGSTSITSFWARGTLRWAAPELLDLQPRENEETLLHVLPTTGSDIYSFGGIMLQVLTRNVPYHYYSRDDWVLLARSQGETPKRPDQPLVTDRQWTFIERCWTSVESRPSSDEIVEFTISR
ncbi:kinase-like protein [Paxillus ammoniavirescens]|nr:kinase-like protein [Paxillus ammoniavirescens]